MSSKARGTFQIRCCLQVATFTKGSLPAAGVSQSAVLALRRKTWGRGLQNSESGSQQATQCPGLLQPASVAIHSPQTLTNYSFSSHHRFLEGAS